jgi:hypothetical protein
MNFCREPKFSLGGEHTVNKYNFFGSITPERTRTLNAGTANLGVQNLYSKYFVFDIGVAGDFTYLDTERFTESVVQTKAFAKYTLDNIALNLNADYKKQYLTTESPDESTSEYVFIRPAVSFKLFRVILAKAGFTFSNSGDHYYNHLYTSFGAKISKDITLIGEYAPHGQFITTGQLLRNNFYFDPQPYTSLFIKKKDYFEISLVYEYGTYFQIDGGLSYFRTENLPYYTNPNSSGIFNLATSDAESYDIYTNLLFHLGPYGIFYGSLNLFDVKDSDGNKIPYYPRAKASLAYGYNFSKSIMTKLTLEYLSKRYTDLENTSSVNSFFDLGFLIEYKFENNILLNLEINNILNDNYYFYEGYQQKPFDITFGVSYLFN